MTGQVDPRLAVALRVARRENLKPPPRLNLVEWADEYRFLSPEASSEPGKWHTSRVEVARGMMLAVSDPNVHEITVMCCTQLAKTELILNIIGYFVHQDPAPMLVIQPTEHIAEAFSKDRVDPMFRDSPALRDRLGDKKSRSGNNTILHKQFPGGHLTMVGANAPGNLAMRPVRVVLCDEVDKYPTSAGGEGDPIKLASERSATFWNYLIIKTCSPTIEGRSRIALEYEASDKRVYEVPCPHCDERLEMKWENVTWPEGEPEAAAYVCGACGVKWTEPDRLRAIKAGQWRATAAFKGHAGFKVSKLASPWEPLAKLAAKWESCKGNPELMKTFYNTQLAEVFKDIADAPEWQRLYDKREKYAPNTVPAEVGFLTAGVDVQKDRLELEIVGWCRDKRSYSIDYRVIVGDTEDEGPTGPWAELGAMLVGEQWEHESGANVPLRYTAVDSGYRTSIVYDFCRKIGMSRVAPVKGREDQALVISAPRAIDRKRDGKTAPRGVKLYTVGSSMIKAEFYAWLRLNKDTEAGTVPPGYCHFPEYDERHFRELTSERVGVKLVRGYPREVWEKTPGVRNEPLDCRVYARAAAAIVGIDRLRDRDWEKLFEQLGTKAPPPSSPPQDAGKASPAAKPAEPEPSTVAKPAPAAPAAKPRRSSFWDRRR